MPKLPDAVLITAGTQRLGFYIAQTALEMGFAVVLHYRTSDRRARQWLQRHPEYNGMVHFIRQDLTAEPASVIEAAMQLPCKLTGLVNNASVFSKGDLFAAEHLRSMLEIHFFVPAVLGASFAERVKHGWIINMTDALSHHPNLSWQNYRLSKALLEELTRQQALLFAPGCRVNAIAPGAVLPSRGSGKAEFRALADIIPLRKTSPVSALAETFRFLVSNTSCTGQIVNVDGGWHLTASGHSPSKTGASRRQER